MRSFLAALGFLTLFPVPQRWSDPQKYLSTAVPFFPVVGVLIGCLAAALASLLFLVLPAFPASTLIVIFLIGISGGMHMDGLADAADGLLSARGRDRMLEIMRDSRIGVMGVIAVVSAVSLKIAILSSIPASRAVWAAFLMPLAGRAALVMQLALNPYARAEQGGLAAVFGVQKSRGPALFALLLLLAAAWLVMTWRGLLVGMAVVGLALTFSAYCRRMIGGYTGDTLGAGCELAEIITIFLLAIELPFSGPTG